MSYQPAMIMQLCRQALALALIFIAMPARAEDELPRPEPDTIIFAMMSGKCSTLNVAGVVDRLTYVSTAGGALLEWLEGKALPGVEVLRIK